MVEPVLAQLRETNPDLMIVTQDDPTFPALDGVIHDADLRLSWHADIETVSPVSTDELLSPHFIYPELNPK